MVMASNYDSFVYGGLFVQGDGAMVLAQSVKLLYPPNHPTFKLDLIAIVSPKVRLMIPILTKAGFAVMERQVPVKAEELQDPTYRSKAPTSGCCGLDELLKLEAWTLVRAHQQPGLPQVAGADEGRFAKCERVYKYELLCATVASQQDKKLIGLFARS